MNPKLIEILKRKSFKDVGLYTLTNFLTKALSFVALLFFVNILTVGDIGILNIFSNSIVFLTPVISLGVTYTISVEYFKLSKNEYSKVFSSSLIIPVAVTLIVIPILYFFRTPLFKAFEFQWEFIWLVPMCLLFNFCFDVLIILLRMENKVKLFSGISLLKIGVELLFSFVFILFLYKTWYGRALGYAVAMGVMCVIFFRYVIHQGYLVRKFDLHLLKGELIFGLAGLTLKVAIFFLNTSDKFFAMAFFGKEMTGFYAVATTFATVQYLFSNSLLQYLQPLLYKKFSTGKKWYDVKRTYLKYTGLMIIGAIVITIGTIVAYHFFLKKSYEKYIHLYFFMILSTFLWSVSNLFMQYIIYQKNKREITKLSVAALLSSALIYYFAASYFSIEWLCYGQIAANIIVFITILMISKKIRFFTRSVVSNTFA